jgi:hypothetical protein
MYVIKKYSASGLWSGEPVESFETAAEAADWLNALGDKKESQGYEVDGDHDNDGNLDWMEIIAWYLKIIHLSIGAISAKMMIFLVNIS